ncbi:MAG: hypothetical protein AAGN35_19385 [Bacteroidota bacterium]
MSKILLYVAIGLGIVFLVMLLMAAMGKGEALRKWMGPIGGIVIAIVAIFGITQAGGGDDLAKIRAENERLEKELKRLDEERQALATQHEKEKEEYETKLQSLQEQIASKQQEVDALETRLASTATKTPLEWFSSLSGEEKKTIKEEIDKGIDWI